MKRRLQMESSTPPPSYLRGSVYHRTNKRTIYLRDRNRNLKSAVKDCMLKLSELKHTSTNYAITGVLAAG